MTYIDDEIKKFATQEVKYLLKYVDWDVVNDYIKHVNFKDASDVGDYMYEIERDADEIVDNDIAYFVGKFNADDLYEWAINHFNTDDLDGDIYDIAYYTDFVKDLQTLKEAHENGKYDGEIKSVLSDILYYSLIDVDYDTSETLKDEILREYSWKVCEKVGLIDKYW